MSGSLHELCSHVKPNGVLCRAIALKGKRFCYFHYRARLSRRCELDFAEELAVALPTIDTPHHIQVALDQTIRAVAAGKLDPQVASLVLRGLKIASGNLKSADGFADFDNDADDYEDDDSTAETDQTTSPNVDVDEKPAARVDGTSAPILQKHPV